MKVDHIFAKLSEMGTDSFNYYIEKSNEFDHHISALSKFSIVDAADGHVDEVASTPVVDCIVYDFEGHVVEVPPVAEGDVEVPPGV